MIEQEAPKKVSPHYKRPSLTERVKECIKRVESNRIDSESEWKYIKRLYEILSKKKQLTEEQQEILYDVENVLEKYANHDHEGAVEMDAQYMNRGKKDA